MRSSAARPTGSPGAQVARAKVAYSTSALTRSGWVAAKSAASGPPSRVPMNAARSLPAASMTAITSSICSSSVGRAGDRVGQPGAAPIEQIRRAERRRRSMKAAMLGSSHQ